MRIFVLAKPSSRKVYVEQINPPMRQTANPHFVVAVKEPPIQGKTNQAIVKALAEYFEIPQSAIKLVSGATSRQKIFDIQTATPTSHQ